MGIRLFVVYSSGKTTHMHYLLKHLLQKRHKCCRVIDPLGLCVYLVLMPELARFICFPLGAGK